MEALLTRSTRHPARLHHPGFDRGQRQRETPASRTKHFRRADSKEVPGAATNRRWNARICYGAARLSVSKSAGIKGD
jgi:hypothetical protein